MGFFQATNGIDSKANVLVTGSVFVSTNISASGNITGSNLFASNTISGSNISASGDIVVGDDIFVKGMDSAGGFTSAVNTVVVRSTQNGQLFTIPTSSFQVPAIVQYDLQTGGTASYTAATTPSVAQLNGGFITIVPTDTPMLSLDLSSITTDYRVEIISYGDGVNDERCNLQIRTPNTGNGWNAYLTGWYTGTQESEGYQWITSGNGNTLFNTKTTINRRLDSSSRTIITIDISTKYIFVHCSNISD